MIARLSADARELAADYDLAVGLERYCVHIPVCTQSARRESGVERAIWIKASDAKLLNRRATIWRERCELATNDDFPIWLLNHGVNLEVRVRIKTINCRLSAHRRSTARKERGKCY